MFDFLSAELLSQNIQIGRSAFEFRVTNYFRKSDRKYFQCYFVNFSVREANNALEIKAIRDQHQSLKNSENVEVHCKGRARDLWHSLNGLRANSLNKGLFPASL